MKEDSVSCWFKAHQPRQVQRPIGRLVFFFVFSAVVFLTDLKASLNNFIPVHLTVLRPPAWHGQMSVQDNPCSKHTQPLEQTALPLQVHIRSCKKSDDLESRQEEVISLCSQPNCKGRLGGTTSEQILSYAPRVIHALSMKVALLNNPDIL